MWGRKRRLTEELYSTAGTGIAELDNCSGDSVSDYMGKVFSGVSKHVKRKMEEIGKKFTPPTKYEIIDKYNVESGKVTIPTGEGLVQLPVVDGHASAQYDTENGAISVDLIAIPGSDKNSSAIRLYENARRAALSVLDRYHVSSGVRNFLREKVDFYDNMLNHLRSRYELVKTVAHEMYHRALDVIGLGKEVSVGVNEGLTEQLVEEDLGTPTSFLGTGYYELERKIAGGISYLGRIMGKAKTSAMDFVRQYKPGNGMALEMATEYA